MIPSLRGWWRVGVWVVFVQVEIGNNRIVTSKWLDDRTPPSPRQDFSQARIQVIGPQQWGYQERLSLEIKF